MNPAESLTHSVWPDPPGWSAAAGWEGGRSRWRTSRRTEDRKPGSQQAGNEAEAEAPTVRYETQLAGLRTGPGT